MSEQKKGIMQAMGMEPQTVKEIAEICEIEKNTVSAWMYHLRKQKMAAKKGTRYSDRVGKGIMLWRLTKKGMELRRKDARSSTLSPSQHRLRSSPSMESPTCAGDSNPTSGDVSVLASSRSRNPSRSGGEGRERGGKMEKFRIDPFTQSVYVDDVRAIAELFTELRGMERRATAPVSSHSTPHRQEFSTPPTSTGVTARERLEKDARDRGERFLKYVIRYEDGILSKDIARHFSLRVPQQMNGLVRCARNFISSFTSSKRTDRFLWKTAVNNKYRWHVDRGALEGIGISL